MTNIPYISETFAYGHQGLKSVTINKSHSFYLPHDYIFSLYNVDDYNCIMWLIIITNFSLYYILLMTTITQISMEMVFFHSWISYVNM